MGRFVPVLRMVARRARGHLRLLAALAVGAVLCSALMAAVILYSDAVRDLGLRHTLESAAPFDNDVRVASSAQLLNRTEYDRASAAFAGLVDRHLGGLASKSVRATRSATFFPTAPGGSPGTAPLRPRANLWLLDDVEDRVRLVEGADLAPASLASGDTAPVISAWVMRDIAEAQGLAVGQEFDFHPFWREAEPVRLVLAGIVEPVDPADRYWMGSIDRFVAPATEWPTWPLLVDEATLVDAVGAYLPDMDATVETMVFVDTGAINSANAEQVRANIAAFRTDAQARIPSTRVTTGLDATIAAYQEKLFFTRLPLFALVIQVTAVILFYLVMVSTMVVERQMGEIALLRSRGAGTAQVMLVYALEGLAIAGPAMLAGPLIAAGAIAVLGLTPPFADLSGGDPLDVRFSASALAMAAFGSLLAYAALLWPAYRACRLTMTQYKQQVSRPPVQPLFFRYYLDLALVGVAALAFYRLQQRGSFVTDRLFGGLSADPILLATPSLFMLTMALIFLRLFPLALRLVLRLAAAARGVTIALALTRMARSPLQHSRLILLLILATAVGMFAAGFRSTLDRGYADRAAYRAGAEARLADVRQPISAPADVFTAEIEGAISGAEVSPAVRLNASFNVERFNSVSLTLLGVDEATFAGAAYWRDDFGPPPGRLLAALEEAPAAGEAPPIRVPASARYAGVWAQVPLSGSALRVGFRLRDRDGSVWDYRLEPEGDVQPGAWQFLVADLALPSGVRPAGVDASAAQRGWQLDGLFVQLVGQQPGVAQLHTVVFDDFQVTAGAPEPGWGQRGFAAPDVLETFEAVERFQLMTGASLEGDSGSLSRAAAPPGRDGSVAQLSFVRGRGGAPVVAFRVVRDDRPLPVLADRQFLEAHELDVGDEIPVFANSQYITLRIAGSFALFPSYDPALGEGLFVATLDDVQRVATRIPGAGVGIFPNEAWLAAYEGPPLTASALKDRGLLVQDVFDRRAILAEQSSDPLVAASWEGILFLLFAAVLTVSALGFVVYSGISALGRSLEFAILRTMGLGARQILGVVTFEHAFVVVAGMTAGTLLGFPLSRLMISYMGLTESGADPLPPLVSVVSWQTILTVYLLLGLVVTATVVFLVQLYTRLAVSRALRMGEL